jgi:uncharacterized protein (DUF362 family)
MSSRAKKDMGDSAGVKIATGVNNIHGGTRHMINRNQIRVIYGDNPESMVKEILNYIKPEEEIDKNALIGIKPNLVVAKPSSSGATTSPGLVAGLIEYLQSKGYKKIIILEGSWVGDSTSDAFRVCGYDTLSKRYNVPLIDLKRDKHRELEADGTRISVCESVLKADYLINMPVLKGHCQTGMTCALKNMKGCIPDFEKRRFHTMGLHMPIACLNKIIRQDLIIVDAIAGDLNFEEGGNPVRMNRVIVGKDPVLTDTYVSQLMGFKLDEIPYIMMAERIGAGSTDISNADILELNKDNSVNNPLFSREARRLTEYIREDSACSACYGSLVHALDRLDRKGLLIRLDSKLYIGQGFKKMRHSHGENGRSPEGKGHGIGADGHGFGYIGQGFGIKEHDFGGKVNGAGNKQCVGIGIGSCAAGLDKHVAGCPPKARDIVEYLENYLKR